MTLLNRLPLSALRALYVTAREQSLTKAALHLHVTPGAIGHQIKGLERDIGFSLFQREGQGLRPTDFTLSIMDDLEKAFGSLSAAYQQMELHDQTTVFRMSADLSFATSCLSPILATLSDHFPDLTFQIITPTPLHQLSKNAVDLAFSYAHEIPAHLKTKKLPEEKMIPVCSPGFFDAFQAEIVKQNLDDLPLLHIDQADHDNHYPTWADWLIFHNLPTTPLPGPHFSLTLMAIEAAMAGQGIALVSHAIAKDKVQQGLLISPVWQGPSLTLKRNMIWVKDHNEETRIHTIATLIHDALNGHT